MTRTLKRLFVLALAASAVTACSEGGPDMGYAQTDDDPSIFSAQAKADGLSLAEGSDEAAGVLRVANELTLAQLDDDVKLDSRAARNIVEARANAPITSLQGLDDIKYVGVRAITNMHNYAVDQGWIGGGSPGANTVHGIEAGSVEAQTILAVANQAGVDILDDDAKLDSRAANNIVDDRPFANLEELDAVSYVGATAFARLLQYGRENGFEPGDGQDELIHGIAAGSDIAIAMLCVANNAPIDVLDDDIGLDSRAAGNIVDAREIDSLEALDAVSFVGVTAFTKLAGWASENECDFSDPVDPEDPIPGGVIHTGDEQCSGEPWRTNYTYTVISNPPRANTPVRINLRYNSRSPYSPRSQSLQLETGPNVWTTVFTTMPAVAGWQQETADIPAETINAAIDAMGWIRLRVNPGTYYVACSQLDVTYNCPECVACPEGQEDVGFGCQDIGAPFDQTLLDHSRGMCSRNSAELSFGNAPVAGGDGRLTLQYLPCDGGRIAVSIQTQNAGWVDIGTDSTALSCGYDNASWIVPEAFLDAARGEDGTINIRYNINDTCRPGMGCANANDPCVRRVNLTYDQE